MVPATRELSVPAHGEFARSLQAPKIRDCKVEDIKTELRVAMVKVGLRSQNWPNDMEKAILIEHIVSTYGMHTIEELRLAFNLAISGRLPMDENDVKCYENFSCLYVSQIMNAYRKWAAERHKELPMDKPKELPAESLTDKTMEDWLEVTRQQVKDGMLKSIHFMPVMLYTYLETKGVLKLTNDEKKVYMERAKAYRRGELVEKANNGNKDDHQALGRWMEGAINGFDSSETEILKNLARKMVLFDYLNEKE